MFDVNEILYILAKKRPLFHSEADFQHAFAWEIHKQLPDASIRLEYPIRIDKQSIYYIDVWISVRNVIFAIELKYKTRSLKVRIENEKYELKNQSAQDVGRYDFLNDLQRLERLNKAHRNFIGYAILLTNDSSYWKKPKKSDTVDADFRIHDGRIIKGRLAWGVKASDGTKKNREQPIFLEGRYYLKWQRYSHPSSDSYGEFRSLIVKIS